VSPGLQPILVVAALPIELSGLEKRRSSLQISGVRDAWAPREGGAIPLAAAAVGIGRRRVEERLPKLLDALSPRALCMVGVAGACRAGLAPGALVLGATHIPDLAKGAEQQTLPGTGPLRPAPAALEAAHAAARAANLALTDGTIVTTSVIATPSAKDSLGRNLGADACDMESYWAARLAAGRGIPFVCVRAIFDEVTERLPEIPPEQTGSALLRRPWLALKLPGLGLRMHRCRRALAALLHELPAALTPPGTAR
jgi:nucleoside phosphorylase